MRRPPASVWKPLNAPSPNWPPSTPRLTKRMPVTDPLSLLRRERFPSGICLLRGDMLPPLGLSMPVLHVVRTRDYTATAATRVGFLRKQAMVMSVSITSPNTA